MSNPKSEHGESLIEILLVIVTLGFIVLLVSNIPNAISLIQRSKYLGLAREIAVKQLEEKRQMPFSSLVNDSTNISDPRISLIPKALGSVVTEDCDISVCTNSENIKQVTVTVAWTENNKQKQVLLKTLIGEGGLGK